MRYITIFAVLLTLVASVGLDAQYTTSTPYSALTIATPPGGDSCQNTWYDPEVFLLPNGTDLGLLAQGGAPNSCQNLPYDAIWSATRNSLGAWATPAASSCPKVKGEYIRCIFSGGANAGPIGSPSVVRLNNVNSASGKRYFMAFVGGNADYIHGKLYWAMSDDGVSWVVYGGDPTENWKSIIQAKYERAGARPRSTLPCDPPSAIGQVRMAYEAPYLYLYLNYYHSPQPECANDPTHATTSCINSPYVAFDRALSNIILRFTYDPNHPWGFNSDLKILNLGTWQQHSGKLVWVYDRDASGNQLPADSGNLVLNAYDSGDAPAVNVKFGEGDMKYGNGKWLRTFTFGGAASTHRVQTAACLDGSVCRWSDPQPIDLSAIRAVYSTITEMAPSGIYYGALRKSDGTFTGQHWWIWTPAPTANHACFDSGVQSLYGGQSLIPAQLCTPDVPCGQ